MELTFWATALSILAIWYFQVPLKVLTLRIFARVQTKIMERFALALMQASGRRNQMTKSTDDCRCQVNDSGLSVSVKYLRGVDATYSVYLPYDISKISDMTSIKAYLLIQEESDGDAKKVRELEITQQPGVPYLVTATQLGGDSIRIFNGANGKSHDYGKKTLPMYAEEVYGDE